ncbi:hypothetical protein WBG78_28545 [Chryseolinea sp. T2]|uniref:hypothetical protein n=1 Tax=Chryseolinea sp. T2 TaxID=3129255 RepID=UPI003076AB56
MTSNTLAQSQVVKTLPKDKYHIANAALTDVVHDKDIAVYFTSDFLTAYVQRTRKKYEPGTTTYKISTAVLCHFIRQHGTAEHRQLYNKYRIASKKKYEDKVRSTEAYRKYQQEYQRKHAHKYRYLPKCRQRVKELEEIIMKLMRRPI